MHTVDEFEKMSGVKHAELIDGNIVEKNGGGVCGSVAVKVAVKLGTFVDTNEAGYIFAGTAGYACFLHRGHLVRKPTVSFVRANRFPNNRIPLGLARLVPDLVVLVVAPEDLYCDVEDRLNDYQLAQVPMVWIVDPDTRSVYNYFADGTVRRLTAEQELAGDPVLPGFRVRVADLFPPPLPDAPELPPTTPA